MTATKTAPAAPLHLHRLEIGNFMRIEALTVTPDGKHLRISGPNKSGKTSAVTAIWAALQNSSRRTPEPVHRGADKAVIKLDLGEYQVERTYADGKSALTVTASDGSRISKPQQLLDSLLSDLALDPVAFLALRPRDQVDQLLAVVGVKTPVEAVARIAGEQVPTRPDESADAYLQRLSGDDVGVYYVRRREATRVLDTKRAALEEARKALALLGGPVEASEKLPDLLASYRKLEDEQQRRDAAEAHLSQAHQLLDTLQADQAQRQAGCDRLGEQLAALTLELARQTEAKNVIEGRIAKGEAMLPDLVAARDKLPDRRKEMAGLHQHMALASQASEKLAKAEAAQQTADRLKIEVKAAQADHKKLEDALTGLRDLRGQLLEGVDLGVPGLEVGDGELRLDGVTFQQASGAQRIRTACAVATLQEPRLRLLRVDGAEALDAESTRALLEWADTHGFQVVMTAVSQGTGLQVEIVEAARG